MKHCRLPAMRAALREVRLVLEENREDMALVCLTNLERQMARAVAAADKEEEMLKGGPIDELEREILRLIQTTLETPQMPLETQKAMAKSEAEKYRHVVYRLCFEDWKELQERDKHDI